ncbi:MAG: hypothetical protein J7518_07490 [Nocardioidaceae bacterium]|nr:hypothetical protein [Nocardioidaceae bacterium]
MADGSPTLHEAPHGPVGVLTAHPDRLLLQQAALAGVGFVVVDAEQTGLQPADVAAVVGQLAGLPTEVHVRVPDLAPATLVAFANTGADELVLPQVRDAGDVRRAHEATRYAPAGTRSRQVSAASDFGTDFSREPRLSVLVENGDAVANAEKLAALDLLAGAWVGPTDLADDLARQGRTEDVQELVGRVVDVFRAAGRPIGLPAVDATGVTAAFARGADRVAVYFEKSLRLLLDGLVAA